MPLKSNSTVTDPKDYWNQVAREKEFKTPLHIDLFAKHVHKGARVLDFGCGYGRTLQELYENGYNHLVGLDFAQEMVARGKEAYPHLDLRVISDVHVPTPSGAFDAIILFAVLTCIVRDSDQQALVRELLRVLKVGGILYVNDFLLNEDPRNIQRYDRFQRKYGTYGVFELDDGGIVRHHAEDWVLALLSPLETLDYRKETFTTMNGNAACGFGFIGQKVNEKR